jgi:predicted lipoprotein
MTKIFENMKALKITTLLFFIVLITACGPDEPVNTGCETAFDQEAMFTNLADNLIIPAYADLKIKVDDLDDKVVDFQSNTNTTTLIALRNTFFNAYLSWQNASPYIFGVSEEVFLFNSVNNFPLNIEETEVKIIAEDYDFTSPDAFDKGFPAIDYLLYGIGNNETEIINQFLNEPKYLTYLDKVIKDIKTRTDATVTGWNTYRAEFITNTGTAAGSSLSLIVNSFNQNYEYIKREKLGIPSGILTLGFTNPTKVEAYYSEISIALANVALEASFNYYKGKNGLGLDDYLKAIGTMKDDKTLDAAIQEQFQIAINTVQDLGTTPLSELVENEPNKVVNAYNEVTKQLINIKTDMPSVLCVSITYIDNPSDAD